MSQLYLQRAEEQPSKGGTGPLPGGPAAGQSLSEGKAASADTTSAANRRVSPRLTSAASTGRRQKREWWKASSDSSDDADEVTGAEPVSSRSKKKKKQNLPVSQKSDQMRQKTARKNVPRSGAGR
jgi:hypothetical protein